MESADDCARPTQRPSDATASLNMDGTLRNGILLENRRSLGGGCQIDAGSQALPGNPLPWRLCLTRRSLWRIAFPGRAWARGFNQFAETSPYESGPRAR